MGPPCAWISPALRTAPACAFVANRKRPAKKSSSLMPSEEATKPAVSIRAPGPIAIPLGLSRNTRPFDDRRPSKLDGSLPSTRFNTVAAAFGCAKCTDSLAPTEKPRQLIMAPALLVTSKCAPCVAKCAVPAATAGSEGSAGTALAPSMSTVPMASAA